VRFFLKLSFFFVKIYREQQQQQQHYLIMIKDTQPMDQRFVSVQAVYSEHFRFVSVQAVYSEHFSLFFLFYLYLQPTIYKVYIGLAFLVVLYIV
jgi:hypothetical protein